MGHILEDRVRDTSTTTGTGALTLANSAPSTYRTFGSVCATGDTFPYAVVHQSASEWETGIGTYSAANTLTRTTVLASSNAGAAVNFSAGTKDVYIDVPAATLGIPQIAGYVANRYYGPVCYGALGSNTVSANLLFASPFFCIKPITWTKMGFRLLTGVASGNARIGVYKDSGNGQPGALLADAGVLACEVANQGIRELTALTIAMRAGWHWLAIVSNSSTIATNWATPFRDTQGSTLDNDSAAFDVIYGSHTYGALPAAFPTVVYTTAAAMPFMWLRF